MAKGKTSIAKKAPDTIVKVQRQRFFGGPVELAANGITQADAEAYVAAQVASNDGASYTILPA